MVFVVNTFKLDDHLAPVIISASIGTPKVLKLVDGQGVEKLVSDQEHRLHLSWL